MAAEALSVNSEQMVAALAHIEEAERDLAAARALIRDIFAQTLPAHGRSQNGR